MELPEKNWHVKTIDSRTIGQRIADWISDVAGSWSFFFINAAWFFVWIVFGVEPYPYGLLTMIVSLEAIFLSTFILISQNRQGMRDRAQAEADYETNRQAKLEIEELQTRLARIEDDKLDQIFKILQEIKNKK